MKRYQCIILVAAAWLGISAAVAWGFGSLIIPKPRTIALHPGSAEATVIFIDCDMHNSVYYSYIVDGREYTGLATSGDCKSWHKGDKIAVYYSKAQPNVSERDEPKAAYGSALTLVGMMSIFVPTAAIFAIYIKLSRIRAFFGWQPR